MTAEVRRRSALWLAPLVLPLYAAAKFGAEYQAGGGVPSAVLLAAAFALGIIVYSSVASVTYAERFWTVTVGAATAIVVSLVMTGEGHTWMLITTWATLLGPPLVVGRLHRLADSRAASYQLGLTVLLVFMLLYYLPKWPEMVLAVRQMSDMVVAEMGQSFSLLGLQPERAGELLLLMAGFVPAAMIITSVLQYTAGVVWFYLHNPRGQTGSILEMARYWRMPRWVIVPVIVAVWLRLMVSGDAVNLFADNLLVCLGVFYSIFGLSAIEYFMHTREFKVWQKTIVYVVIVLTHVIGLAACAMVGIVDSLFGWRRQHGESAKEKETVLQ